MGAYIKYGVKSPKFIWAPCAQLYSLAANPKTETENPGSSRILSVKSLKNLRNISKEPKTSHI
jgi:hypothetical protein